MIPATFLSACGVLLRTGTSIVEFLDISKFFHIPSISIYPGYGEYKLQVTLRRGVCSSNLKCSKSRGESGKK